MKMKVFGIFWMGLTSISMLHADVSFLPSAGVASRWLNVPASARVAALAGAFAARGGELGALEINPAGLAGISRWQAYFTHDAWIEGMQVERVAGAYHPGCLGTFAASLDYLNLGEVDKVGLDSLSQPVSGGTLHPTSLSFAGAWAGAYGPVDFGASLRTFSENLVEASDIGFEGDLGGRLNFPDGWRLGAAVQNLGVDGTNALRPVQIRSGVGYTFEGSKPLALDLNADLQPYDQEPVVFRAAGEWAMARQFILRAGYVFGDANQPTGPTAGLGWLAGPLEVDYAADGAGALGLSHLVTLRVVP
jgi:hypothetical protein